LELLMNFLASPLFDHTFDPKVVLRLIGPLVMPLLPRVAASLSSVALVSWGTSVWVPRTVNHYGLTHFEWRTAWIPGFISRWTAIGLQGTFIALVAAGQPASVLPFAALMAVALNGVVQADMRMQVIPDRFQVVGALGALGFVALSRGAHDWAALSLRSGGGVVVALVLCGLNLAYQRWRKREALGWGDVKLIAWLGVAFGVDVLCALLYGMFLAQLVIIPSVLFRLRRFASTFAFGPYIVFGVLAFFAQRSFFPF
jgi:Flp pilus assembly protein protease CpaA